MLTEYEVRIQAVEIEKSEAPAMRKVRGLLRLARVLKLQARTLLHAQALSAQTRDWNVEAYLKRRIRSLRELYEEVRRLAQRVWSSEDVTGNDLVLA
ncbi:MAG: hypothetical protein ABL949_02175 [Fimbriimonadaceae bacterium]